MNKSILVLFLISLSSFTDSFLGCVCATPCQDNMSIKKCEEILLERFDKGIEDFFIGVPEQLIQVTFRQSINHTFDNSVLMGLLAEGKNRIFVILDGTRERRFVINSDYGFKLIKDSSSEWKLVGMGDVNEIVGDVYQMSIEPMELIGYVGVREIVTDSTFQVVSATLNDEGNILCKFKCDFNARPDLRVRSGIIVLSFVRRWEVVNYEVTMDFSDGTAVVKGVNEYDQLGRCLMAKTANFIGENEFASKVYQINYTDSIDLKERLKLNDTFFYLNSYGFLEPKLNNKFTISLFVIKVVTVSLVVGLILYWFFLRRILKTV